MTPGPIINDFRSVNASQALTFWTPASAGVTEYRSKIHCHESMNKHLVTPVKLVPDNDRGTGVQGFNVEHSFEEFTFLTQHIIQGDFYET